MTDSANIRIVSGTFSNRLTGTTQTVTMPAGSSLSKFRADHNLGSARLRVTNPNCEPTSDETTILEDGFLVSSSPAKADGAC